MAIEMYKVPLKTKYALKDILVDQPKAHKYINPYHLDLHERVRVDLIVWRQIGRCGSTESGAPVWG